MLANKKSLFHAAAIVGGMLVLACGGRTNTQGDAASDGSVSDRSEEDGAFGRDAGKDGPAGDSTIDSGPGEDGNAIADSSTEGDGANDDGALTVDAAQDALAIAREQCLNLAYEYLPAPIIPPYAAAGLDMRGGPTGNASEGWNPADAASFTYNPSLEGTMPITVSEVTSVLCDPHYYVTCIGTNEAGEPEQLCEALAFAGFDPAGGFAVYYGSADGGPPLDVWAIQLQAWIGGSSSPNHTYSGTIEATGTNGTHYSIGVRVPIMATPEGGPPAPMAFGLSNDGGAQSPAAQALINRLYAALMTQFLPGQTVAADCFASGDCAVLPNSFLATIVLVPLHLEIDVVVQETYGIPPNNVIDIALYSDPPPTQ
jgi:hypothetical protein